MASMIPGSAQTFDELKWRFTGADGKPMPEDDRLRRFAERYARNWVRKYGSPPHSYHPFPNYWETKFVIEYAGPAGFLSERIARERESARQA